MEYSNNVLFYDSQGSVVSSLSSLKSWKELTVSDKESLIKDVCNGKTNFKEIRKMLQGS